MITLFVWPEIAVRETTVDFKDSLVISITSPGSEHPKIKGNNVHKFHFHDIREPIELFDGSTWLPMSESVAEAIAQVAVKNMDKNVKNVWLIHCEAGISRSPGVAIGLSRYVNFNLTTDELIKQHPCYNKYVCKLVEKAMRKEIDKLEKDLSGGCDGFDGF